MANMADNGAFGTLDIRAALYPDKAVPIDARSLFSSYEGAAAEAKNAVNAGERGLYYFGQQICVVNTEGVNWYVIVKGSDGKGDLQPIGASVRIDETTKHWIIDGHDTGVVAEGKNGEPGKPGPKGDPGDPGQKGDPGESGIAAPVSGFFTVGLDEEGNLYAYSADGKTTPGLIYNPNDGGLYADVEGWEPILLGCVKGPQGEPGKGIDVPLERGSGENALQQTGNDASGPNSAAYGYQAYSVGEASQAEGIGTAPLPEYTDKEDLLAQWLVTKFLAAVGYNSRVQGKDCLALGAGAYAQGLENAAIGNRAVALGNQNTVKGNNAFACGSKNTVDGLDSGSIGSENEIKSSRAYAFGLNNTVQGAGSAAIGSDNTVIGAGNYGFGNNNTVKGVGSAAVGQKNTTEQGVCFAFGRDNLLSAFTAFAFGLNNIIAKEAGTSAVFGNFLRAVAPYQAIFGKYNAKNADALFMVGNGTGDADDKRSNIFEVLKDGTATLDGKKVATADDIPDGSEITAVTIKQMFADGTLRLALEGEEFYLITED